MSESKPTDSGFPNRPGTAPKPASSAAPDTSLEMGLAELAQLAKQAFEEKRRKHAIGLSHAILKIDPQHKFALMIQSWIRTELQHDLETARSLAEEAVLHEGNRQLFARAEALLKEILGVDPAIEEARIMLLDIVSRQKDNQLRLPFPALPRLNTDKRQRIVMAVVAVLVVVGVTAAGFALRSDRVDSSRAASPTDGSSPPPPAGPSTMGWLMPIVVPASGVEMTVDNGPRTTVPPYIEVKPGEHRLTFSAAGYLPESVAASVAAGERRNLAVFLKPASRAGASSLSGVTSKPAESPVPTAAASNAQKSTRPQSGAALPSPALVVEDPPAATGTLAVNSSVPVEIYMDGKHIGSTPVSLELLAGPQTLEYHYGSLQKTVSHTIAAGETIRTTVTFEVVVQINARPWAQVFIEGAQSTMLGQTPLSDVRVAAGTVLVFRNPGFPEKKYRVRGEEKSVQVVFP